MSSADAADLAFAGFAHFSAMQVRGGRVRGLDLHLQRLARATQTLFDLPLGLDLVRGWMATAVRRSGGETSLTVTVRPAAGEFTAAKGSPALDVVVRCGAPAHGPPGPLNLAVVSHERFMPHVKHVGEGAKTYFLRQAVAGGFDDVAFTDTAGHISEASIWNLAFFDGDTVIWPAAAKLVGTTMGVLQRQLSAMGVPQTERALTPEALRGLAAVVMNSWTPAVPVSRIGEQVMSDPGELVQLLHRAFQAEEPVAP